MGCHRPLQRSSTNYQSTITNKFGGRSVIPSFLLLLTLLSSCPSLLHPSISPILSLSLPSVHAPTRLNFRWLARCLISFVLSSFATGPTLSFPLTCSRTTGLTVRRTRGDCVRKCLCVCEGVYICPCVCLRLCM